MENKTFIRIIVQRVAPATNKPMNPYGIKRTSSNQAKKYEQLLSINLPVTERSGKGRKDKKGALSPINSDFLEKVLQIKNSKMTPTLQITSERSSAVSGHATTTGFYAKPFHSPTNASFGGSPRNGHFLASSFIKNSFTQEDMHSPHKTQVMISPELTNEQQNNISQTSERRKNYVPTSPSDGNRSLPFVVKPHATRTMSVSEVYENLGDFTNEIKNIIEQKYDEQIQAHVANNNWRQVLDIQSLRVQNIMSILDRRGSGVQGNRIQDDLNKVMKLELSKIANVYENAIIQSIERTTRIKSMRERAMKADMDICGALRALVEYCNFHRVDGITKEGFDKAQKMFEISEEINEFKIRTKLKKNYDTKLIEVFEELESAMKDMTGTIDRLKFNCDRLVEENKVLLENSKTEISKFREDNLELIKKHFERQKSEANVQDLSLPLFKEKHYQLKVVDLENKLKELHEKVKTYEDKYKKTKSELTIYQQNPDIQRTKTKDIGVGVNLYSERREAPRALSLPEIVNLKGPINGGIQSNLWIHSAVTLIYSDKLISDLCDDYERRPRKTLKEFLVQWCFKRFGIYSVCDTLLRDLIYNARLGAPESHRLKLFCLLCGIDDEKPKENEGNSKKPIDDIERKNQALKFVKDAYYQSIEAQWLYFKMCLFIKHNTNPPEIYGPFLPSTLFEGSDLIPVDVARQTMNQMALDEKFEPEKIRKLEEKFDEKLGNDLYLRVEEERQENQTGQPKDRVEGEHKYVRIDIILHLFMDQLMEHRAQELDQFVTSMKLNQINTIECNLSLDEFQSCCAVRFPKAEDSKSQAWQEHAFTEMHCDPHADRIYFEKLVHRLIPAITNQHYTKGYDPKSPVVTAAQNWLSKEQGPAKEKKAGQLGKDIKLISLNMSSRFNTKFQGKAALNFVPGALFNTAIFYYDYVSSMLNLLESYELFREKIEGMKDSSEQLELLHEEFKEDLSRFPQGLQTMTKFEVFQQYNMGDLALYIEGCWKKFRILLGMATRILR